MRHGKTKERRKEEGKNSLLEEEGDGRKYAKERGRIRYVSKEGGRKDEKGDKARRRIAEMESVERG